MAKINAAQALNIRNSLMARKYENIHEANYNGWLHVDSSGFMEQKNPVTSTSSVTGLITIDLWNQKAKPTPT